MQKICFIGASGHTGQPLSACDADSALHICAAAPGGSDELAEMRGLCEKIKRLAPDAAFYDDWRKLIEAEKPDVAVVSPHFHRCAEISAVLLEAGIHVYAEKPAATAFSDLEALETAAAKSRAKYASMFTYRFDPAFFTAFTAIKSGAVGEIRIVNAQKSYKLGRRAAFFSERDKYGGTISWVGSHGIDWLYWLSGERFLTAAACQSAYANGGNGSMEATAACVFGMENGVIGTVTMDYLRPENAPTHGDDRVRVVGTKGIIEVCGGKAFLSDGAGYARELPLSDPGNIFSGFCAFVRGENDNYIIRAEDSFCVARACLKAQQSADEHILCRF